MQNHGHSDIHIGEAIEEYLNDLKAMRYSPTSLGLYEQAINDVVRHVKKDDPRAITRQDLEKYRGGLLERGFKPASVVTYLQSVKLFFRHLEERQKIFVNPVIGLAPIKKSREMQPCLRRRRCGFYSAGLI